MSSEDDWQDDGYEYCDECLRWVFEEAGHTCGTCGDWVCNACWDTHVCPDMFPI